MLSTLSTVKPRLVLDHLNFIEWNEDQRREHAAKTPFLTQLFKGVSVPADYEMPRISDFVKLADGTTTTTRRFETSTDLTTNVTTLTATGSRAFELANNKYIDLCEKRRTLNSSVLLDMQIHMSTASILKIQSQVGLLYEDVQTDLVTFYQAVIKSHSKSDPVALMDIWVKLTHCKMEGDYFNFIHLMAELKKQLELKFAKYLDSTGHTAAFIDTILTLQLALGVSKKPEYVSVLELLRQVDFTTPVPTGSALNFSKFLELFTNATVTASVLSQFDDTSLIGNTAISKKKAPVVNSTLTESVSTQCKCKLCGTRMPVKVDYKTKLPFDVCIQCFRKKAAERKAAEDKSKSAASAKRQSTKPLIPLKPTAASATALIPVVDSNDFLDFYTDDESI
jgi:hypothetical protein